MKRLNFRDLLERNGIPPKMVYLIRHSKDDNKAKICRMAGREQLFNYTRIQPRSGFRGQEFKYWAVFNSEGAHESRLLWFCEARTPAPLTEENLPTGYPAEWNPEEDMLYDLTPLDTFKELEGRLVIDWGGSSRPFTHEATSEKAGDILLIDDPEPDPFPGFDDLILSYDRLEEIITTPDRHSGWYQAMSSVNAIYLILDTESGQQYIGSASGIEGLWGRWRDYIDTKGTGNNDLLENLMRENPKRRHALRFSVLRVVDRTLPDIEKLESKYKEKLGSCVFGLNAN